MLTALCSFKIASKCRIAKVDLSPVERDFYTSLNALFADYQVKAGAEKDDRAFVLVPPLSARALNHKESDVRQKTKMRRPNKPPQRAIPSIAHHEEEEKLSENCKINKNWL